MLARAQRDDERVVRELIDAVADAMPRNPPTEAQVEVPTRRPSEPARPSFEERLQARLAKHRRVDPTDLPQLVRLSIRVEADEEELVAGAVRLVPQVHDEQNPLHLCDLATLWTHDADEHGFGDRARTHATIALRAAADAWPVLDRLLELRVPDQLVLDTDELVSLLDEGVGALRERGVDVLWPRSLGRDLSATATLDRAAPAAPREEPLNEPLLGTEALFAFRWQVALHGDPLTERGDGPARVVGDPADAAARQLDGRRPGDRAQGPQAAAAHREAGRGGGGRPDRHRAGGHRRGHRSRPLRSRWSSAPACSRCASSCSPRRPASRSSRRRP